ncbi:MAG: GNAT family N-acetyltransferase [Pseudomonadota bacterium]
MSDRAFHETMSAGVCAKIAARMQALIPVLETERLILRAPKIEDFDAYATMLEGQRGRFYGNPKDRGEIWESFMQLVGTWILRGHGVWAVTGRETGAVMGFVQIGAEPGDQEPELGYLVAPEFEGQGVASEAAQAVKAHAFGALGFKSLVSYVDEENTRSIALAQRLGATRDAAAEAALPEADKCCVFRHVDGRVS